MTNRKAQSAGRSRALRALRNCGHCAVMIPWMPESASVQAVATRPRGPHAGRTPRSHSAQIATAAEMLSAANWSD